MFDFRVRMPTKLHETRQSPENYGVFTAEDMISEGIQTLAPLRRNQHT